MIKARFVERTLTVLETARRQGRDALEFITLALEAYRTGVTPPSLVPQT